MTSPEEHTSASPPLFRPIARKPPNYKTQDATPPSDQADVSRSRSSLNLYSSTLSGIYADDDGTTPSLPSTPWEAETAFSWGRQTDSGVAGSFVTSPTNPRGPPAWLSMIEDSKNGVSVEALEAKLRRTVAQRQPERMQKPPKLQESKKETSTGRVVAGQIVLFGFGLGYGGLIDRFDSSTAHMSALYILSWGIAGVILGNALPWIDSLFERHYLKTSLSQVNWHNLVRSLGAFVGIVFAIRRLPWETTLQLSLTLALTNPLLWYLLDRTAAGFILSATVSFCGTLAALLTNPAFIPVPTPHNLSSSLDYMYSSNNASSHERFPQEMARSESIGTATWIGSVLFCSCVCFGNIGRVLVNYL
jgi:hypothetical protein